MQNQETRRSLVQQLHNAKNQKFAVFMRSPSGASARFKKLHDTLQDALDISRQHASEVVSRGTTDFTYYVVEIKHRVGIENGKLVDEPMA